MLVILSLLLMNLILEVCRVDYQVLEIDFKIQRLIKMFTFDEDNPLSHESAAEWMHSYHVKDSREFSYY